MSKSKKVLLTIGLSLIIISSVIYILYFFFGKKDVAQVQEAQPIGLTEEQRITILEELNSGVKTNPITDTERKEVLKDLNAGVTNEPLTDAQRTEILNSLNQ